MEWRKIKKKIEDNWLSIVLVSAMLICYVATYIHEYRPELTPEEYEETLDRLEATKILYESKKPFTSDNLKALWDSIKESKKVQ